MPGKTAAAPLHREDHSGLTAGLVAAAAVVTAAAAFSIRLGGIGPGIGGALLFVALVAWVFVYEAWLLGLRIDEREIRLGAVRRAEARARRGQPPPRRASPAFTFLYEYRCPLEAVRRAWILHGLAESWNPGPSTGVEPVVRAGHSVRSRRAWLRVPLVRAALVLQVDPARASWPRFAGTTWRAFAPVPADSVSEASDIWYTPVRHPASVRAALAEALGRAGREIDDQGYVRVIGRVSPPTTAEEDE